MFTVVAHAAPGAEGPASFADLCQQGVEVATGEGATAFSQATDVASCVYTVELADGTTVHGVLGDNSGAAPDLPTKPEAAVDEPTPKPAGGYGDARRLSAYSSKRRLSGLVRSAQRMLDAAGIPVPQALQGGRRLSTYGSKRRLSTYESSRRLSTYGGEDPEHVHRKLSTYGSSRRLSTYESSRRLSTYESSRRLSTYDSKRRLSTYSR